MLKLVNINNRLTGLQDEYAAVHKAIAGTGNTELSQASEATAETINGLKQKIFKDYDSIDQKLNGKETDRQQ